MCCSWTVSEMLNGKARDRMMGQGCCYLGKFLKVYRTVYSHKLNSGKTPKKIRVLSGAKN